MVAKWVVKNHEQGGPANNASMHINILKLVFLPNDVKCYQLLRTPPLLMHF